MARTSPSGRALAALGERLRQLPEEQELVLSATQLRTLAGDARETTVAALVLRLAYEARCNYLMVASQAVFTKRPRHPG